LSGRIATPILLACLLMSGCSSSGEHRASCHPIVPSQPAAQSSPSAEVGAYYFDGWAGAPDGFHFAGLREGPFSDRMPLYGWSDKSPTTMQEQLRWAAMYGIGFFVFDWYFDAGRSSDPNVNQALRNYHSLRDHAGIQSALLYVNSRGRAGQDDFVVPRSRWRATVEQWVTQDFVRKDYLRIAGKPVLFVFDANGLSRELGGDRGVQRAFAVLNRVAHAHGLPGVFVVGGVYVDHGFDWARLSDLLLREHYDALTQYAYPAAPRVRVGARPFGQLVAAAESIWSRFAAVRAPFIPDVMAGWDPRPWNERVDGRLFWFRRSPSLFGEFVRDAVRWSGANPRATVRRGGRPLILVEAWNELGEGSYIVPTVGTCHSYGRALVRALNR
jgi:glycosyl transferase family WbsX